MSAAPSRPGPAAEPCDVAILGAGPAGIAAALTLRREAPHLSVRVAGGPETGRGGIGETLPPGAQALLVALDLWTPFLSTAPLAAYGSCAAWGRADSAANEFIFHPDRRGWHIDRSAFDRMLADSARSREVGLLTGARLRDAEFTDGRWRLRLGVGAGTESALAARFVIDATGRAAVFASRAGSIRIADDRLVALAVTCRPLAGHPWLDTYTCVEACADGWWYSSLLPDGDVAVVFFTDADLARAHCWKEPGAWQAALTRAPRTQARLAAARTLGPPVLRAAESGLLDRLTGEAWLATGDAASTFDPLSSQGVVKALRQGTVAAYAVADHLAGKPGAPEKYEALLRREHREFLTAKRTVYREEQRWADAPFWHRRHGRIWLQPDARLLRRPRPPGLSPLHLATSDLERLCRACAEPRLASEVVAAFGAEVKAVPDDRVILALQHLVEADALHLQRP